MNEPQIYKVRLLIENDVENPFYDHKHPDPHEPRHIKAPVGFEIEGRDAWRLCIPNAAGFVIAEPASPETVERVKLAEERRNKLLNAMTDKEREARARMRKKFQTLRASLGVTETDKVVTVDSKAAAEPAEAAEATTTQTETVKEKPARKAKK